MTPTVAIGLIIAALVPLLLRPISAGAARRAAHRARNRAFIRREARLAASRRRRAARVQGATGAADGEAAQ